MRTKVELPKVSICSNNVGYSPKMEGYATLMSDITELYDIVGLNKIYNDYYN